MANSNENQRWLYLSPNTNPPNNSSDIVNSAEGLQQIDRQGWLVLSPANNSLQRSGVNQRWLSLSATTNPLLNSNEAVDSIESLEDIDKQDWLVLSPARSPPHSSEKASDQSALANEGDATRDQGDEGGVRKDGDQTPGSVSHSYEPLPTKTALV